MRLSEEKLSEVISYIKNGADVEQDFHKSRISALQAEASKIQRRMDRLTDLFLDGDLDKKTHEEKRAELVKRREEIAKSIENHNMADDNFSKNLITLVGLASKALTTFNSSTTEEKRKIVNLVFENLKLKSQKLEFKLCSPFDAFVNLEKNERWCRMSDLN